MLSELLYQVHSQILQPQPFQPHHKLLKVIEYFFYPTEVQILANQDHQELYEENHRIVWNQIDFQQLQPFLIVVFQN